ncbi:MAG: hypothetical protein U0401_11990 [Anaerolineae bacterium]
MLRNGRVTANLRTSATSPEEICRYMVAAMVLLRVNKLPQQAGETVLAVEHLSVKAETGRFR